MNNKLKTVSVIVNLLGGIALLYIDHLNNRIVSHQNIEDHSITVINIPLNHSNFTIISAFGVLLLCIGIVLGVQLLLTKTRHTGNSNPLSTQEDIIKSLIQNGKTNKEIAIELSISVSTVKSHISSIFRKLNINTRKELVEKPGK